MKLIAQNQNRQRCAFTLIDVMVGMGVLGVGLVSLFASFTFGFNVVRVSREDLQATQLLHEKMETIRLYNWEQVTNTQPKFIPAKFHESMGDSSNFFSGEILISPVNFTNETYSANLRKVTVTVKWTNNSSLRSRSTSTFVSQYGIQNYIFLP